MAKASAPKGSGRKKGQNSASGPTIIKKYANRRLYNTGTSSYITLDHLAAMTREGEDFQVVDAKSGEDITRSVLTQIIMEEETKGQTMLPTSFLREIISLYGNQMQAMLPSYLEASMSAFRRNQEEFAKSVIGATPLGAMAKQNMKMFEAAFAGTAGAEERKPDAQAKDTRAAEIDALKAELAAMREKLEQLE